MPIFTSDLTSSGIIYADTITTNSNEDLTLNPAGTGSVVANARFKVNEISADDSTAVSIKSPLQLDSTLQVASTSVLVGNVTMLGTFTSTTGSSVGNLTLADGSITDSSGTITFNDENLTTTGNITAGNITGADIQSTGTVYTDTIASVASNENITLTPQGTGAVVTTNIQLNQIAANDSSAVSITSPLQTGNIQSSGDITANDISLSGNLDITSNGTITIGSGDSTADLTLTHDGTDVYLTKAGTSGEVYVRGRNISLQNDDGTQTFVTAGHGGATELYHGGLGSPGLITTVSGGISIPNGTLLVNTIASGDSASVRINDSIETDGLTVNGTVSINNVQLAEINNTQVDSAVEDIDTWSATTYRAAKYVYRITNTASSEYQAGEIMVLHDGTNVQIAEYSLLRTGNNDLITFSVDIDSGNVRLRGSAQATGSNIKLLRTLIED